MKTHSQALKWVNNRIGRRLDMDGAWGSQCMDLTIGYCQYLSDKKFWPWGDAKDLKNGQNLPEGWKLIQNTPSFLPQPGDIAIWAWPPYNEYGHTGIITYATLSYFYSVDQNWFNPGDYGSPAAKVYHDYTGFWGVIRPAYKKSSTKKAAKTSSTKTKATPKAKTVKSSNVWRRNNDGVLWKTESATFKCTAAGGITTRVNGPWTGWAKGPYMYKNDEIEYEEIQDFDGYIWVSGKFKGKYVYIPVGYSNGKGQRVGAAWGNFR